MRKILIIGGGIAGIEAAIYCRREGFEVELVTERDYVFVYPVAIWIPVGIRRFEDVAIPLEPLAQRYGFILTVDRVAAISAAERTVTLERAGVRRAERLIVALGSGKMKHSGIEHTLSICGAPEQSGLIKERIDALVAAGGGRIAFGFGGNPADPSGVRGGPAFELFFNVHHYLKQRGIRDAFEMTFFAPMASPGARMGGRALDLLASLFRRNGFGTRYGKKIGAFEADGVVFEDGSRLESDLTMFIPAGAGHPVVRASDLPQNGAGFVTINDFCEVEGVQGWYAAGDVAALEGPEWRAKQGHIAEVMARNAAHNAAVAARMKEGGRRGYKDHVNIVCVMDMGDGAGIVYRDDAKALLIPLPVVGHWLKIAWGWYYKNSKMGRIPRLPGL